MLSEENVSEERSVISRDNSLEVYDDKSAISLEASVWTTLISLDVSLDKSLISVLKDENVNEDKSAISEEVDALNSLISLDNSLEV